MMCDLPEEEKETLGIDTKCRSASAEAVEHTLIKMDVINRGRAKTTLVSKLKEYKVLIVGAFIRFIIRRIICRVFKNE